MEIKWLIRPPEFIQRIYPTSVWKYDDELIRLSFDDGPGEMTKAILRLLDRNNIRGNFFVLPGQAKKYSGLLKDIKSAGHRIGLHSNNHSSYWHHSMRFILNDLMTSKEIIENIVQDNINIYRAPYGRIWPWQVSNLKEAGFLHWFWSCSSLDYKGESSDTICNRLNSNIESGDVVLFHDGVYQNQNIVSVVERIIGSGYSFEKQTL